MVKGIFSNVRNVALVLLILGLVLRLFAVNQNSLWLDEATSLDVAAHSISDIIFGRAFDNHTPPFYYFLLHFWLLLFPVNEFGLRLLSVLFDVVNIVLVVFIFREQFGLRVARVAGLLHATASFALYYACEGRMYSLLMCIGLLTYWLALRLLQGRRWRYWSATLFLTAVCGLYTHYYYAFFLAAVSLGVLFSTVFFAQDGVSKKQFISWCMPLVFSSLAFLPWIQIAAGVAAGPGQTFRRFLLTVPPYAFFRFIAGYAVMPLGAGMKDDPTATLVSWLPVILPFVVVFGLISVVAMIRYLKIDNRNLFLFALLGPAVISLLLAIKMNILSERYWGVSFPYFIGLLALLPWGLSKSRVWMLTQLAVAVLWLGALGAYYFNPEFGFADWRRAAKIAEMESGATVVLSPDFAQDVFQFYYGKQRPIIGVPDKGIEEKSRAELESAISSGVSVFIMVQSAEYENIDADILALGLIRESAMLLPQENGIRVNKYRVAQSLTEQ